MNDAQISQIIQHILNDQLNIFTPLLKCKEVIFFEAEKKVPKIDNWRFKFDIGNSLVEIVPCRLYSKDVTIVPSHEHYDIHTVDGIDCVFEFLTDGKGKLLSDFLSFESIVSFEMR